MTHRKILGGASWTCIQHGYVGLGPCPICPAPVWAPRPAPLIPHPFRCPSCGHDSQACDAPPERPEMDDEG